MECIASRRYFFQGARQWQQKFQNDIEKIHVGITQSKNPAPYADEKPFQACQTGVTASKAPHKSQPVLFIEMFFHWAIPKVWGPETI